MALTKANRPTGDRAAQSISGSTNAPANSPKIRPTQAAGSSRWSLYYGQHRTPLALVVASARYAGMWRIAWPDGQLSDIANLTRCKDAVAAVSERGPPRRDTRLFKWEARTLAPRQREGPAPVTRGLQTVNPPAKGD
jgi:hypothetical protein